MPLLKTNIAPIPWILIFITVAILCIGTIFSINFTIDPFGNRNWIVEKKYKPIIHERSEKYNTVFHQNNIQKYDCVILGSSRVMSIVPSSDISTKECYNFGVHVANNPEKLFILQEWLKHAPLKTVYLGNELYNVHTQTRPNHLNPHGFINGSEGNYLSPSTLLISFKTFVNYWKHQPQSYFEEDGSINHYLDEQAIKSGTFDHSYQHFKEISKEAVDANFIQNPFIYETKALQPLKQIKKLCDQHHIKLYPFITPTFYEAQVEMHSNPLLATASQKFRDDLIEIFGKVYDFDLNASENRSPSNFYDPVHYRPVIGNLIINKIHHNGNYGSLLISHKRQNSFYER